MVLYFFWALWFPSLYNAPYSTASFAGYALYTLAHGFNGTVLWYLWVMLACYGIVWLITKEKNINPLITVSIIFVTLNLSTPSSLFGLFQISWYGLFFFMGYFIKKYQSSKWIAITRRLLPVSLLLFPLCAYLFEWLIPYQSDYAGFGLVSIVPAIKHGSLVSVLVVTLMVLLGMAFAYTVASLKPLAKLLANIGASSLTIYLLHILFIGITPIWYWSALISFSIPYLINKLLTKKNRHPLRSTGAPLPG